MAMEATQALPTTVKALQKLAHKLQQQVNSLYRVIDDLQEERRVDRARRFAASSEKGALQYCLFDEAEQLVEESLSEPEGSVSDEEIEVKSHKRRGGRKPLPADLPRVIITHKLSKEDQRCTCGGKLEKIDEVISEQLDIIPAQVTVIEHRRYKYSCKHCKEAPKTAVMPPQPIPKSRAWPISPPISMRMDYPCIANVMR